MLGLVVAFILLVFIVVGELFLAALLASLVLIGEFVGQEKRDPQGERKNEDANER